MNDYAVKNLPRPDMTSAAFVAALRAALSPVSDAEAETVYAHCAIRRVSHAWLLAVFRHESGMGRLGTAISTKSWGNTRKPSFGVPDIGTVAGRGGMFSAYPDWASGGISTVARACDHKPYANATTVREITKIWAPPTDGNDTAAYIKAVLADIARFTSGGKMDALATLANRQVLMAESNANWGKTTMRGGWPSYITIHETGNRSPGANAIMHANYVRNGGGTGGVSFHAVVDEHESIQIMPWNWVAWHASDGAGDGNYDSIAIETCQIGDFAQVVRNLVTLVARLMAEFKIPIANVVQHNHWAPDKKNCPEFMRANNNALWRGFVAGVTAASKLAPPVAAPMLNPVITEGQVWGGVGKLVRQTVVVKNTDSGKYFERTREYTATGPVLGEWEEI